MQPQLEQSGAPPNWHGVIFVSRSADTHSVVCAKMQSSGDDGGSRYASSSGRGICSFVNVSRITLSCATTRLRSSGASFSADSSPTCGVYRLNQIDFTFG